MKAIRLCSDAIVVFKIRQKGNAIEIGEEDKEYFNLLDNSWLECGSCSITSDSNEYLENMLGKIEF